MLNTGTTPRLPKYRARAHNVETVPENVLWRHVLFQGIRDIYDKNDKIRGKAIRWLASDDFATVCDLALIEAESLREQVANLATLPVGIARQYGHALHRFIFNEEIYD